MTQSQTTAPQILLPDLPSATPTEEAVLFAFDEYAFPFRNYVQTHLIPGKNPRIVLPHGESGIHDEVLLYYGTVIRIDGKFHMWYNGNYGSLQNTNCHEREHCVICYATSEDGVNWEKPVLNLVEFNGSKENNIVDLQAPTLWSTGSILYEPDETDVNRRYKMCYEARYDGSLRMCAAYSPDGLRWTPSPNNPVGPFVEMAGITKRQGLYYLCGQASFTVHGQPFVRRISTFVSADFENWSSCSAMGLDRGPKVWGPPMEDCAHQFEEVHLGAGLWNRGNVIIGIYGQWHGHPSGDRGLVTMDLGLALSHDALHYHEPIPGFRIVPGREQPERPLGVGPSLMQGQGMENVGDETLYWYSLWRGTEGSGVRMVSWGRDRIGMLKPFYKDKIQKHHAQDQAHAISCPITVQQGQARVYVNASDLGEYTQLRIELLDLGFRPIEGYSGDAAAVLGKDGFRIPVKWGGGDVISSHGPVRVKVSFEGIRPEDGKLHAVYIGE